MTIDDTFIGKCQGNNINCSKLTNVCIFKNETVIRKVCIHVFAVQLHYKSEGFFWDLKAEMMALSKVAEDFF